MKVKLRPIEAKDLEFLRLMHNDPTTLLCLTDARMVNELQQRQWFENMLASKTSCRLAVVVDNHIIGCVRLDHYDAINRSVQVGGDISTEFRGKGFGSLMFEACLDHVFNVLNCHRAYLSVLESNEVALKMYVKHGFVEEGRQREAIFRNGKYLDYINMGLLENEYRSERL